MTARPDPLELPEGAVLSRKLPLVFVSAAAVALPALLGFLPGGAAAAETPRLSVVAARAAALAAAAPLADQLTGDALVRVTGCQRVSPRRVDCTVLVTAPPAYECRARAVVRRPRIGRAMRIRLRDVSCVG